MERPIQSIRYTTKFEKRYRLLSLPMKKVAESREVLFRQDAFHPLLHTHKLHGDLAGCWAFSVGYDLRIVFRFVGEADAIFLSIGTHDSVY
jgi:mRNA-degrading endonuclease YafQ of YafQ-DinJ toxin-antitoxin module